MQIDFEKGTNTRDSNNFSERKDLTINKICKVDFNLKLRTLPLSFVGEKKSLDYGLA